MHASVTLTFLPATATVSKIVTYDDGTKELVSLATLEYGHSSLKFESQYAYRNLSPSEDNDNETLSILIDTRCGYCRVTCKSLDDTAST